MCGSAWLQASFVWLVLVALWSVSLAAQPEEHEVPGPLAQAPVPRETNEALRGIGPPPTRGTFEEFQTKHRIPGAPDLYSYQGRQVTLGELRAEWEKAQNLQRILTLKVNVVNGELDFWRDVESRRLTYAVDRKTFSPPEYDQVVKNMAEAGKDWERACPECQIKFEHRRQFDARPSHDDVVFIVRKTADANVLAVSFFPSDPAAKRIISIGPAYFSPGDFDKVGILRHALGHVLGYRHSHIGVPGCFNEGGDYYVSGDYDPKSVMHYLCGGGGTKEMRLSEKDIASHRLLYGVSSLGIEMQGKGISLIQTAARTLSAFASSPLEIQSKYGSYQLNKRKECLKYLRDIGLPTESVATISDREDWQTCFGFGRHFRQLADGRTRLPLVKFEAETRTKRVEAMTPDAISLSDSRISDDLFRFAEGVGAIVEKMEPRYGLSLQGQKTTLFTLYWRVYKAVVYGSGPAMGAAWEAIEKVGKPLTVDGDIKDVATHIRQSVTSEIQQSVQVPKYSNGVPPIVDPFTLKGWQAMCQPDANAVSHYAVSHYMAVLGGVANNIEERQVPHSDATILDVKCHMPRLASELCSKCSCQNPDVHCTFCPHNCSAEPKIVVIDSELHQDAIGGSPSPGEANNACAWAKWDEKFHGTHMAGLAAGRKKFFGIAPSAEVAHIRRQRGDDTVLDQEIQRKMGSFFRQPAAFLFASQFCYHPEMVKRSVEGPIVSSCDLLSGRIMPSAGLERESIIMSNPINRVIRDGWDGWNYPWVVAIGQPSNDASPVELFDERSLASPMSLADLPNVILVTACHPCDTNDPRLWPKAHKGKANWRPHIAAPGGIGKTTYSSDEKGFPSESEGFPSVADKTHYTIASGTSQSAAVVAGVVAKMQSCYPNYYTTPAAVKRVLQVTARPITHEADRDYIKSGVIDVGAALKHPVFHYLKDDEQDREILDRTILGEGEGQATIGWCNEKLTFETWSGGPPLEVTATKIRRIVEVDRRGWVIRWEEEPIRWDKERVIQSSAIVYSSTPKMILKFGDRTLGLDRIKDLTTFRGLDVVGCQ